MSLQNKKHRCEIRARMFVTEVLYQYHQKSMEINEGRQRSTECDQRETAFKKFTIFILFP